MNEMTITVRRGDALIVQHTVVGCNSVDIDLGEESPSDSKGQTNERDSGDDKTRAGGSEGAI